MDSCRRSSRGEKDGPTGRAAVAGATQEHLAVAGGEPAYRQRLVRRGESPAGSLAMRARRRLIGARIGVGVSIGVLLEQGEAELLSEVVGALLALGEGDEVVVGGLGEHEVEGGGGLGQEAAAQLVTVRSAGGSHGGSRKG